jgi:ketosteroid isomerase-like protein
MALRVRDGKIVEMKEFSDTLHVHEAIDAPETRGPRKERQSPLTRVTRTIQGGSIGQSLPASGERQERPTTGSSLLTTMFDALQAGDLTAFRSMCTPDMTIWHNFTQAEQPLDQLVDNLSMMLKALNEVAYVDRRYQSLPDGAFGQHTLTGATASGKRVEAPAAVRVRLDAQGKVRRIEEYMDSAHVATIANELS